jgi:hypothetical protein
VVISALAVGASGFARSDVAYAQTAPRVHIRGAAKIDARASSTNGSLVLSGTLRDDLGQPLPGQKVVVSLTRGGGAQRVPLSNATPADAPTGCQDPPSRGLEITNGETLVVGVDDVGRFCVRIPLPRDRYSVHLESVAMPLLDAAKTEVSLDLAKRSLALRFDPPPRVLSLDGTPIVFDGVAQIDEDTSGSASQGKLLTLADERGTPLGAGSTNGSGHVRFVLDPTKLAAPGPGELRLEYAGDTDTSAGSLILPVQRRARVTLALAQSITAPGSPEEGIPLELSAGTRTAEVSRGSVEVRFLDQVVGAAPVEHGHAHAVVSFLAPAATTAPLVVAYLPDAPWYDAGEPLAIDVPIRGPSPLRQWPLAIAGAAVAAFLALGRLGRRPHVVRTTREQARAPGRPAEARMEVVRPAASGEERRWRGRVFDAHDGTPVEGARLVIEHATFGQREAAASAFSDREGNFLLDVGRVERDATLVCEGVHHSPLRQKLPQPGELEIALISRKRALLDRLVGWARRQGRPFDLRPEPTPGQVRRAAGEDFSTAQWAGAVEQAAFGPGPVDARVEEDVDRLAPKAATAVSHPGRPKLDLPPEVQTQVNQAPPQAFVPRKR